MDGFIIKSGTDSFTFYLYQSYCSLTVLIHVLIYLISLPGISGDCDSGYEASTLESIPTCSLQTSPQTDSGDIHDSLSSLSEIFLTPSRRDLAETSQDSIEAEDDNVSIVSEISGLSDLSGQDWKPMAGSMIWVSFK